MRDCLFFSYIYTAVVIQSDTVVAYFIFTLNLKSMDNIEDVAFEVVLCELCEMLLVSLIRQ